MRDAGRRVPRFKEGTSGTWAELYCDREARATLSGATADTRVGARARQAWVLANSVVCLPSESPHLAKTQLRLIKMARQTSLLFWMKPLARKSSWTSATQRPTPGPELSLHVAAGVLSCLVRMTACAEFSLRRPRCHTTGCLLRARSGLFVSRDKQVLIPRAIPWCSFRRVFWQLLARTKVRAQEHCSAHTHDPPVVFALPQAPPLGDRGSAGIFAGVSPMRLCDVTFRFGAAKGLHWPL